MYSIYKITNDINDLVYIGCTTKPLNKRFSDHLSNKKQDDFHKAINSIGREHFKIELIEQGEDNSVRFEREKYYISLYKSNDPMFGYNRTIGGLGTIGYTFTEEAKHKISLSMIGRKPTEKMIARIGSLNRGKHLTKECRDKISKARLGKYTGKDNPFYGKHHTKETIDKILKSKKELGLLRPVIGTNVTTNEVVEFESLTDAGRYIYSIRGGKLSTLVSHIQNTIKGIKNAKKAYGFKWIYKETLNDYPDREYSQCETH